jgi:hypothetical protein
VKRLAYINSHVYTRVYEFDFAIARSAGVRYFFRLVRRLADDH